MWLRPIQPRAVPSVSDVFGFRRRLRPGLVKWKAAEDAAYLAQNFDILKAKTACSKSIDDYVQTAILEGQVIASANMTSVLYGYNSAEYDNSMENFDQAYASQSPIFVVLEKFMGRDKNRFEPK